VPGISDVALERDDALDPGPGAFERLAAAGVHDEAKAAIVQRAGEGEAQAP
jgi:hypothetical protein